MTRHLIALLIFPCYALTSSAQSLPNTQPLERPGDIAAQMVAGIDKYLMRELAASPDKRKAITPKRENLKKVLGLIDERVKFTDIEYVGGPNSSPMIAESESFKVFAIRWPVFAGVDGEGLLIEPKGKPLASVVAIPDAGNTPEQLIGLEPGLAEPLQIAKRLGDSGCRVIVPTLINRESNLSNNPRVNRTSNIPHREFIYRMAYEMGRTLTGMEVQKVLAAVDWLERQPTHGIIGVTGRGEGGRLALFAGAVDERIQVTGVHYYFGPRERMWEEPIDRNLFGVLNEFGDAELASMFDKRKLVIGPTAGEGGQQNWPVWTDPIRATKNRPQGAPGVLGPIDLKLINAEVNRRMPYEAVSDDGIPAFVSDVLGGIQIKITPSTLVKKRLDYDPIARHKRQFDQLVSFVQRAWRSAELERKAFWSKADSKSVQTWEQTTEAYRKIFWEDVIGKLPKQDQPFNPRSRQIHDTPKWTGYEVTLDLYPDVFAYGILLMPKGMKPDEKRPVVVCQHGLEGRPSDIVNPKEKTKYYNSFGAQLADMGYIVFAPQNPYIGYDDFRVLQRKANPLKLSLFSFIIRQHETILDWMATLPNVDAERMAFYGLSYGGKTAMRVPAVLPRYCLSICSGDFNEWIGKNVVTDIPMTYMFTFEYEMYEFDLGRTFNYAEMAYLIAPRPFMVERGHDDGVGTDEMVAWEFAKVRYLYQNRLKLGSDRTTIEWFVGGHEINGKGTFEFLNRHLKWQPK